MLKITAQRNGEKAARAIVENKRDALTLAFCQPHFLIHAKTFLHFIKCNAIHPYLDQVLYCLRSVIHNFRSRKQSNNSFSYTPANEREQRRKRQKKIGSPKTLCTAFMAVSNYVFILMDLFVRIRSKLQTNEISINYKVAVI